MEEVWIYADRTNKEILAFSSEEKLMTWVRESNPNMKSLRLMPDILGEVYTLLNHNTHLLPYSHRVYRLDLDTGIEVFFSRY